MTLHPSNVRFRYLGLILSVALLGCHAREEHAQGIVHDPGRNAPVVVSRMAPRDSRGETVYERKGPLDQGRPVVPGTLVAPVLVHMETPRAPRGMAESHGTAQVVVDGVVSEKGDYIDALAERGADPAYAKSAVAAASGYRFHPATLDGKPVAVLLRVVIDFRKP